MVYHITDFQDSFLVVEDGQAADKKLSKLYGNSHHLLTKTTMVGSQDKRHITRSYVATPRVAARTATFQCCYCSTISISVSNCFRELPFLHLFEIPAFSVLHRLEVSLPQLISLPVLPLDFSVDSRHYLIVQQTYQLFTVLLVSRLPLRTPATGC